MVSCDWSAHHMTGLLIVIGRARVTLQQVAPTRWVTSSRNMKISSMSDMMRHQHARQIRSKNRPHTVQHCLTQYTRVSLVAGKFAPCGAGFTAVTSWWTQLVHWCNVNIVTWSTGICEGYFLWFISSKNRIAEILVDKKCKSIEKWFVEIHGLEVWTRSQMH
jgi:hypothetical protein